MDKTIIVTIISAVAVVLAAVIAVIPRLLKRGSRREGSPEPDPTEGIVSRNFFQGNLSIVRETILVVVGTSIGAERYDRVLAQLQKRILHNSNIEADIITDILYYKKNEGFKSSPIICIGSRGTNRLVNEYEVEFDLKDRETTAKVFTDGQRPPIAFIYGGGVKQKFQR